MKARQRRTSGTMAVVLLVFGIPAVASCGRAASSGGTSSGPGALSMEPAASASSSSLPAASPSSSPTGQAIAAIVAHLSPAQLAGQRLVYSYHGLTPPAYLLARIRAGRAAGVIVFGRNVGSPAQLRAAVSALQEAAMQSPVKLPLLVMTDQEGGLVRRLPGPPGLSERAIGLSAYPAAAAGRAGQAAGLNLRNAGLNVNLAPVLDVVRAPGDFIDRFGRSYGRDPAVVARLGDDFITAQQRTGVAATAKHFPGLGAASAGQNTDKRPVVLRQSLAELRTVDEAPFAAAVGAGVRLVMVSWARYPELDPAWPAGLSQNIVQGELRRRLGFTGVTITDSLGAGALAPYGPPQRRAVLAARAGMDLLLCGRGPDAQRGLAGALRAGQLDRPSFAASVLRVLQLRRSLAPASTTPQLSPASRTVIAASIHVYFDAINARRFRQAWLQLSPRLRATTSVAHLADTDSTTHDFDVAFHSMTAIDDTTAVVYVTFTSTQAASQGPDGDTRDEWTLDYTMKRVAGRWLIDDVAGHAGSTHTSG